MTTSTKSKDTSSLPPMAYGMWNRWDFLLDAIQLAQPNSILEFGVGKGGAGARLARMVDNYVGVEPDDTSREIATENVGAAGRVVKTYSEIAGTSFDLVCAFEVLEHIEDDLEALTEWVSYVPVGGHVLLSVPAFRRRYSDFDKFVGHHRRYDPEDLKSVMTSAGLNVRQHWLTGAPIGFFTEYLKVRECRRRANKTEVGTFDDRTAASGRFMQPQAIGMLMEYGSLPSRFIQRRFQTKGTGLVMLGQRV